ncbi:hypothetical protein [Azospirillum argentinense]|nr:hypothetical protein [Azospirillum argentinense]KAA1056893.1 Secreted protein [Azospirillum argentinense]
MRVFAAVLCGVMWIVPAWAGGILLEEKAESAKDQAQARHLRDGKAAPNSLLGDVGVGMGKAMAEGMDSSRVRGATVATALPSHHGGKCSDGKSTDPVKHDVRFSNGEHGLVVLQCNRGCWQVSVYPGGRLANNCGEFQSGGWATASGALNQYGARLVDVVNFLNNF